MNAARGWTHCGWMLGLAVMLTTLPGGAQAARQAPSSVLTPAEVQLRELPRNGPLSKSTVTLRDVAAKYRKGGVERLSLYVWAAADTWAQPVPPVAVSELRELRDTPPDGLVVSVVAVYSGTSAKAARLHAEIQAKMDAQGSPIPTFVDVGCQLASALAKAQGWSVPWVPDIVTVSTADLSVVNHRGDLPVSATIWARTQGRVPAEGLKEDPASIPRDCRQSWFRREIAIAAKHKVMPVDADDRFFPHRPVTEAEFQEWLTRVSPRYAGVVTAPRSNVMITRGRAIAAAVKALYGNDPDRELTKWPVPTGEASEGRTVNPVDAWRRAFSATAGSADAVLHPYLRLALAAGLLHGQPSLHAEWSLTREAAAWLLAAVLVRSGATQYSGIIVDARGLPFEPDRAYGNNTLVSKDGAGRIQDLYSPAHAIAQCTPSQASAYPVGESAYPAYVYPRVLCTTRSSADLQQRVGERPLTVVARGVSGRGARAKELVLDKQDADAIVAANKESAFLDFWRVAIVTGLGVAATAPASDSAPVETKCVLQFSAPIAAGSIGEDTFQLLSESGERVPADREWQEGNSILTLRPRSRLDAGARYQVVLRLGIRGETGEALEPYSGVPEGTAYVYSFRTESRPELRLMLEGAPAGATIYLGDAPEAVGVVPEPGQSPDAGMLLSARAEPGATVTVRIAAPGKHPVAAQGTVARDGALRVTVPHPKPQRAVVTPSSDSSTVGTEFRLSFRLEDGEGDLVTDHGPVSFAVRVTKPGGSSVSQVRAESGAGVFTLLPDTPGPISIDIEPEGEAPPVSRSHFELRCRLAPGDQSTAARERRERHRLPVASGAMEVAVVPSFWQLRVPDSAVRVVGLDGQEFQKVDMLPAKGQFEAIAGRGLLFHPRDQQAVVEIGYWYQPRRAAIWQGPVPAEAAPTATPLQAAAAAGAKMLEAAGYEPGASEMLPAVWGSARDRSLPPTEAEVRLATDLLGLGALLALEVRPAERRGYELAVQAWTADLSHGGSVRAVASGTIALPARDATELAASLGKILRPWLSPSARP